MILFGAATGRFGGSLGWTTGAWWFREDHPVYIASTNQLRDLLGERGSEIGGHFDRIDVHREIEEWK
jgi:hypothetical protein